MAGKEQREVSDANIRAINAKNVKYTKMVEACVKYKERTAFVAQNVEVSI